MSGLVVEYPHTKNGTDASADEGDEKESGLPDTPEVSDRLSLVNAHHGKAGYVHHDQIWCDNVKYIHNVSLRTGKNAVPAFFQK